MPAVRRPSRDGTPPYRAGLASEPASLQIDWQSAFVGDVVQPVTELMTGDPAKRAVGLPNIEPFEDRPDLTSAGQEVRDVSDYDRLNQDRRIGASRVEEVPNVTNSVSDSIWKLPLRLSTVHKRATRNDRR